MFIFTARRARWICICRKFFHDTMRLILSGNPLKNLDAYLQCDEWSLFSEVQGWLSVKDATKAQTGAGMEKIT